MLQQIIEEAADYLGYVPRLMLHLGIHLVRNKSGIVSEMIEEKLEEFRLEHESVLENDRKFFDAHKDKLAFVKTLAIAISDDPGTRRLLSDATIPWSLLKKTKAGIVPVSDAAKDAIKQFVERDDQLMEDVVCIFCVSSFCDRLGCLL